MSFAQVGQARCNFAAIRAAPDKHQCTQFWGADEGLAEFCPAARHQCGGQTRARHHCVRQRESMEATLSWRLCYYGVACQQLHQFGVHQHTEWIVP